MTQTAQPAIHDITEADFWSSLAPPPDDPAPELLAEAIRLGQAGEKGQAYASLAQYHLAARGTLWQLACEEAKKVEKLSTSELNRLIKPLNQAPDTTDLDILRAAMDAFYQVALQVIKTGNPKARAFLVNALLSVLRNSRSLPKVGVYPLYGMLGAHYQYQCFWTAYLALLHTGGVPAEAAEAALKLLLGLGREMCRVTARYMVHNIFTAANYGLFYIARSLPEFREAATWDEQTLCNLDTDLDRSFYADGGHLERNWWYGFYTARRLTDIRSFALRTGGLRGREEHFLAGLQRAYRFYAYTLDGNNLPPSYGDEGGLKPMDIVFEKALSEGIFPPDTPPDLGVDRGRSYLMEGAGVAIMRNGAGRDSAYATVSFGEFAGWHSHHDLLSLNFRALGEVLIEEVPRFGPYEHPMDILWRGPEAHNQLLVDTFLYDARPIVGQDVHWYSDNRVDYFSAYHTAYRTAPRDEHRDFQMSADLIVRRTMVFVKDPGYLLVMDSVRPDDGDRFNRATSQWWHSPQPFRMLGDGRARTTGRNACLLTWAYPESVRRMKTGDDFLPEDLPEPHRPAQESWHHLRLRTWMEQPYDGCLGFITVLLPFAGDPPGVEIRSLPLAGSARYRAEQIEVTTPAGRDTFLLNPERLPDVSTDRTRIELGNGRGKVVVE
ncbi:MAG: heparinase II/III family protein [Armatimonadota bacterium]